MSEQNIIPVYVPRGEEVDYDLIKAAKISMPDLPRVTFAVATKFTAERILAWGANPTWLCDYILVTDATTDEHMAEAVRWVITGEPNKDATEVVDILTKIFGPGTREISPEELEAERILEEYNANVTPE